MSHGCRNLLLATKNLRLDTNQSPKNRSFAVKKTASLLTLGQRCKHHGSRLAAALPVKKTASLLTLGQRFKHHGSRLTAALPVKKTASLLTLGQRFKHHGSRLTAALPVKNRKQYEHQHPRGHCRTLVCRHPGVVLPPRRHRGQCHRIRLRRLLLGSQRPHRKLPAPTKGGSK